MAWHTHPLDTGTRQFVEMDGRRPYLVALLLDPGKDLPRLRRRARNYWAARRAEAERRPTAGGLPYHLVVDPSNVCNLRCGLCVQATDPDGRPRRFVETERFSCLVREVADHAVRIDLFNWGEPLLHPDFASLAAAVADSGVYARTSSHMSHDHRIDWEAVVRSGLRYLVASIDGATQETYGRYRVRGQLDKALASLDALVGAKRRLGSPFPIVEWQYLVFAHNEHEVDAARDLARDMGVDVFRYGGARGRMSAKTLLPSADVVAQSRDYLLPPDTPLSEYDAAGGKLRREEGEGCHWLWGKMAMHPDGGVSPCWTGWFKDMDIGRWTEGSLAEVWNGPAYRAARQAALQGGDAAGATMCDRCAHHRNFVPPPDFDREPIPDRADADAVARLLSGMGCPPSPEALEVVLDAAGEFAHA